LPVATDGDDTDDGGDESEALFNDFRFKTFRQHKLIEEDYELLKHDEPEELPKIKLDAYMTK